MFAIAAREPETAYVKSDDSLKPEEYFRFKYEHTAGTDNVVWHENHRLQLLPTPERQSYAKCKAKAHVRIDGSLAVYYQRRYLETRPAPLEATQLRKAVSIPLATVTPQRRALAAVGLFHKPTPDHPWRGKFRTYFD